jgi:hypothetical protein
MLQRIQTVYILLVVVLMAALTFFPLAVFQSGDTFYKLDIFQLTNLAQSSESYPTWWMFVLTEIIAIVGVIALYKYKNRILQIRLCVFNAIMLICYYALFGFTVYIVKQALPEASLSVKFALSFPLISLILDYLAIRNIGADEILVRSLDRLR